MFNFFCGARLIPRFAAVALLALATAGGCPFGNDLAIVGQTGDSDAARTAEDVSAHAALTTIGGQSQQPGDYQLFDLGPSTAGERWLITPVSLPSAESLYVIALFDAQLNLLARSSMSGSGTLSHVMRHGTDQLRLGVAFRSGRAGEFRFQVRRLGDVRVPEPRPQLVWLNFGPGVAVQVGGEPAVSFGAFDAARLGPRYAGQTAAIKSAIVATLRECYRDYNIDFLTSDESPEPTGPHSTIHFGGAHETRLGSADGVDRYNADRNDRAVIYTDNFARYAPMELAPDELGRMIGNVSAHELGHLLGLYHTLDHEHVMNDPVENAWHLVAQKNLDAAPLEPSVFPIGSENAPLILAETLGRR